MAEDEEQLLTFYDFPVAMHRHIQILNNVIPGIAGVVDDDVNATKGIERGLHEAVAEVGCAHVTATGNCLGSKVLNLFNHGLSRVHIEIIHDDTRPLMSQFQRDRTVNAAPGARNNGSPAGLTLLVNLQGRRLHELARIEASTELCEWSQEKGVGNDPVPAK